MTHFGTTVEISATDYDWLATGSQIGSIVNQWAERTDIIAYIGSEASKASGAPASFNPASAQVEVNTTVAFGHVTPVQVGDLRQRTNQFEFPKATGAIFHEAMHARFSTWDLPTAAARLTPRAFEALHLLEESRIERRGIQHFPDNKAFLRTCALEIVLGDTDEKGLAKMSTVRQAAHILGLTYARVDAGVLLEDDVEVFRSILDSVLSPEKFEDFRSVWREFQTLDATAHVERMYELAELWESLIVEAQEEAGEEEGESGGEGEAGEGESGEPTPGQKFAKALMEALKDAAENAEVEGNMDVEQQQTTEDYREQVESSNSKAEERSKAKAKASEVFGAGTGPTECATTYSELVEERAPKADERASAVKIGKALDKAKYRDRDRVVSGSDIPPGRLRTRALVQGEALKSRGLTGNEQPFKRVQHKNVDDPTLTVGVMVDISGSMNSAMKPMASAAWILSEAVRRIQGKASMVYYGSGVFATLKPGQHLEKVRVYSAPDATERFDDAFMALDGQMNLLHGTGARLLVIVSDGYYRGNEVRAAQKWLKRCEQSGVAVLWIGAGKDAMFGKRFTDGLKTAKFVRMEGSATSASDAIGKAAADALTAIGSRR
jgi:hypothetical protein